MIRTRALIIGTDAGPQVVVSRLNADAAETILYTPDFEKAARAWRGDSAALGPGGYVLWLNDGDIWRRSGTLLHDAEGARALRERVLPLAGERGKGRASRDRDHETLLRVRHTLRPWRHG